VNVNDFLLSLLFWTVVLFVLSYRMLHAKPENEAKYSELIGTLILTALMTTFIAAIAG